MRGAAGLGPVELGAQERLLVLRVGDVAAAQPCAANSDRRPVLTASAKTGSVWSVKNCQGVSAPHSSPMNSMGVNGAVSTRPAATRSSPSGGPARLGDAVAGGPVANLVVVLEKTTKR